MKNFNVKEILIGAFLLFTTLVSGQESGTVLAASKYSSEERLNELLEGALARDMTYASDGELARHYHLMASCYFYLGDEDIARYYLFKSLEFEPKFICHFARLNVKRDIPEAQYLAGSDPTAYFVTQMEDDVVEELFRRCTICCNGGEDKHGIEIVDRNPLDILLLEVRAKDQKYRGPYGVSNIERQSTFDEENRKLLDSLYTHSGFPGTNQVNSESMNTIWLVWHHSTDCKWNALWLDRMLDHVQSNEFPLDFIPWSIEEKYDADSGSCMERKKKRTLKWLDEMREKYSPEAFEWIDR